VYYLIFYKHNENQDWKLLLKIQTIERMSSNIYERGRNILKYLSKCIRIFMKEEGIYWNIYDEKNHACFSTFRQKGNVCKYYKEWQAACLYNRKQHNVNGRLTSTGGARANYNNQFPLIANLAILFDIYYIDHTLGYGRVSLKGITGLGVRLNC